MEGILNKNICDDKELRQLAPDYRPENVLLRMQVRRTLTKDTHSHDVNKYNKWQRKSMRKTKDSYSEINKEIVKLRNNFHNVNMKNQIMLKHVKCLNRSYGHNNNLSMDEYRMGTESDVDQFFDFTNDVDDLIIKNDKYFKINPKPELNKLSVQSKNYENIKDSTTFHYVLPEIDESTKTNVRIECTSCVEKSPRSDINEENTTVTELQKLLIMMALSSKSNNIEEKNCELASCNQNVIEQNEIIESKINKLTITCNSFESEEFTNVLNITPMRIDINDRQKRIITKYVEKWKKYVQSRKEFISKERQKTLDIFFNKIERKKLHQNHIMEPVNRARDYSTYQHRYKVQKHIIALQKAKLEEQNRLIDKLKYNKIIEASRQSVDAMREEVRKTYYEIDRQLKPKIKCLTNELRIPEIEESALVLQCLKVPQFLQRMEKRAREREEKHAVIRERRKQMEEERIRLKLQAELAKAEMDKEEKLKRMKELRERRKREKIENIRKKQYVERMRALAVMADLHYEKYLMVQYGIRPLKQLMEIKRDNIEKANAHFKFQLKKNVFLHFMWYTEDMWFERNYKSEDFYRKKILKKGFEGLKQNYYEYILKRQVAEDYYDLYVTQLIFRKLQISVVLLRKEHEIKWEKVVAYYNSNLLFKTLTCWRTLPALNALKREQEVRKARWREKVLQVVPDYTPPDD